MRRLVGVVFAVALASVVHATVLDLNLPLTGPGVVASGTLAGTGSPHYTLVLQSGGPGTSISWVVERRADAQSAWQVFSGGGCAGDWQRDGKGGAFIQPLTPTTCSDSAYVTSETAGTQVRVRVVDIVGTWTAISLEVTG